ncbi:hypothetical protein PILCRDRAFT_592375 [Piloderma croceum F 1598]|uniref:NADP-dependent oxidoreductase domain-containing protein n=1 Tax=Piloderma croceum (strain F 1598) TaxID=765440 RepID=A0A0C3BMI8_PILCF|nr:hypothetical protein PILCRDRAFT_592375 [Piloderma croceum F 1598]
MSFFSPPPKPATKLGHYRALAPSAGLYVSPLQLGAMSIGDKWGALGMGSMNKESSFKLLDAYFEAGGNFIDTANNYQDGSSEEFIGEWAESRGIRDQLVIATKYTANLHRDNTSIKQKPVFIGNHLKSMRLSLEASLKKLRTSYVDIFYVHWWDFSASVEEVMNGLNNLIQQGKVLYLGISNAPAWIVSKANQYARDHGKTPFSIYQGAWNVMSRDFEREIIPMARSEGLALAPWNVLAGGKLRTDAEEERRRQTGEKGRMFMGPWERNEDEKKMAKALEEVAKQVGTEHITAGECGQGLVTGIGFMDSFERIQVAIAYVLQKTPYVFPIIGGRKVEHMLANVEALSISLTPEQISFIENVIPFNTGFPHTIIGDGTATILAFSSTAQFDKWPVQQAIRPTKE